jgi:hypothetical protein
MESADDPVNIKQVVRISVYDLEKLILFTKYETKIWNSSIQEVTDILKKIIIDTESYKPDSKLVVFMGRIEQYLGLSVKSISICMAIVSISAIAPKQDHHFQNKKSVVCFNYGN